MSTYFVSFSHTRGFGNTTVKTNKKIEEDTAILYDIKNAVENRNNVKDVVILYFKLLKEE